MTDGPDLAGPGEELEDRPLGFAATDEFRARVRQAALVWKAHSPSLPDLARLAGYYTRPDGDRIGPFDICLPQEFAACNLLSDVREAVLELFSREEIKWHDSVAGGPSNHLLDSQVQCVNALGPGILDPEFVNAVFGDVLPIAEVLPIEGEAFLTFEYIGAQDHLGERTGGHGARGSMTTSTDGAIRYRTHDGDIEVALIEWKFTEDYRGHELRPPRGLPRTERYRRLWESDLCPVRHDIVPYEDLFVEPFYQLFRQQLLAGAMESVNELDASRVRVVHVCPAENLGVHGALNRESHRRAGTDVLTVWSAACSQPDRFISIDGSRFLGVRHGEYLGRYNTDFPLNHVYAKGKCSA